MTDTFLGAGIGYRRVHRDALLGVGPRPDVLEVMPEHFFAAPSDIDALAVAYPLVFHAVGLSIATAGHDDTIARARLARVAELVRRARPALCSDHLALTVSPRGIDLGHLAPVPYTEDVLAVVSGRMSRWQDVLGVPIALENIARPFTFGAAEMPESEFFTRLVDATGCGMLLDLTNLLYNARNFDLDARAELLHYPMHAVAAVHLAGGMRSATDGFWVDSHSSVVEDDSLALLAALRGRAWPRVLIVERDEHVPSLLALTAEAQRVAAVWRDLPP